ncbi:hypothetical protein JW848_09260 [Candidatus Bipolaricaulota bacterium]|nr:hypothetical protein [Candidatus Bipolaricaulota bacterium]
MFHDFLLNETLHHMNEERVRQAEQQRQRHVAMQHTAARERFRRAVADGLAAGVDRRELLRELSIVLGRAQNN